MKELRHPVKLVFQNELNLDETVIISGNPEEDYHSNEAIFPTSAVKGIQFIHSKN